MARLVFSAFKVNSQQQQNPRLETLSSVQKINFNLIPFAVTLYTLITDGSHTAPRATGRVPLTTAGMAGDCATPASSGSSKQYFSPSTAGLRDTRALSLKAMCFRMWLRGCVPVCLTRLEKRTKPPLSKLSALLLPTQRPQLSHLHF